MSRHVIDADILPSRYEIVVGFDMALDELFACVFDRTRAAADDQGLVLAYNSLPRGLVDLTSALAAYVTLPSDLLQTLDAERRGLENEPAARLQLRLVTGGRNGIPPFAARLTRRK